MGLQNLKFFKDFKQTLISKIRVQNDKPTVKFRIRDIGNNGNVVWQKNKTDNNCKRMYFGQLLLFLNKLWPETI